MKEIFNQKITAYKAAKKAHETAEAAMDNGTGTEAAWDAAYSVEFAALTDFIAYLSGLLKIEAKTARKMIVENLEKIETLVARLEK